MPVLVLTTLPYDMTITDFYHAVEVTMLAEAFEYGQSLPTPKPPLRKLDFG